VGIGFCHEHALILYVYLPGADDGGEESVLTVSICTQIEYLIIDGFSTTLARTACEEQE
jgi:hypothetical protein